MVKYIIFIDSDGTLKNDNGEITQRTKKIIKKFIDNGNYIVLCTGRPRYHADIISEEIGANEYYISSNGAEIFNNKEKKIINIIPIIKDDCINLYKYAIKYDIKFVAVTENEEYVTKEIKNSNQNIIPNDIKKFFENHIIKQILLISKDSNKIKLVEKEFIANSKTINILNKLINNKESWISVGNSIASKGYALEKLAAYLEIDKNHTIAIGNDYNDITMFGVAGKSVAMGNADIEIKEKADIVIDSNNDEGVAKFLEKFYKDL